MEANRKRNRGLLKGKIAPLFRTTKPSSTLEYTTTTTTNVKPNHSSPSPASFVVVHKDYAKPNPKVSIVVTDCWSDNFPSDESVDMKAAIYISMVQQRLKAEQKQVQDN